MTLRHELSGSGATVVLLHAGIADSRMWDPQWSSFAVRYRLLRCDLSGFGSSPLPVGSLRHAGTVADLLDELRITGAAIVGCSLGGRVALELAVARPDLVTALVLVGAALPGHEWSAPVRAYWAAEDEAVERGDLDAATELNLRMWVDGPRRAPTDVEPALRARVGEMSRCALELQTPRWESLEEELLVPDLAERLGEVRATTLVVVGDEDIDDMHRLADKFASTIVGARHVTIEGAAHLPSLEQPAAFDAVALGFLEDVLSGVSG